MTTRVGPFSEALLRRLLRFGAAVALVLPLAALVGMAPGAGTQSRAGVQAAVAGGVASSAYACPDPPSRAAGKNFRGRPLAYANFSRMDLTNADFTGARLQGAVFIGANLTGANFRGATFAEPGNPAAATDFTLANLDSACFIGATFDATTYFTHATLTCADFSDTVLGGAKAIFGEALKVDAARPCRVAFRNATMNCEFIDQWPTFDLSSAKISRCGAELAVPGKARDFSGALLSGVDFSGLTLDSWKFVGAQLGGAYFNRASLQGADLSHATLSGAQFNNANLSGASLHHAFLSNTGGGNAANLKSAHLKNANLAFADLTGADLSHANFYGDNAAGTGCKTTGDNHAGFTVQCASAHGAHLTATTLTDTYLYGVDFSSAIFQGTSLASTVLVGASFAGAILGTDSGVARNTSFGRAFVQGSDLRSAQLSCHGENCYDLTDAFVDFRAGGNAIYILLNGTNHNDFASCPQRLDPSTGRPACRQDVCVFVAYGQPTALPDDTTSFTCPDHSSQGGCGAPSADGRNPHWKSLLDIGRSGGAGVPPAWYDQPPTYPPSPPSRTQDVCGGQGTAAAVLFW